ncbi:MAG: AbrB/MazE/SpoVT family DNA-binding domain-containing protein [Desulfovibrio sp.]|jgi:antitoxin MazE|nr:AbrB/MazE/SpoVT family DNA-binding domain-containing protein [Desulfovibrio sp.]
MRTQTTVSQWGNSLAIRLPRSLATELTLKRGTEVELHLEEGGFRVTVPSHPPKSSLYELLEGITPDNTHREIDWGSAQGKEAW